MKDVSDQEMARECLEGFDRPTDVGMDLATLDRLAPNALPDLLGLAGSLVATVTHLDTKMREVMDQVAALRTDVLDCRVELKALAKQYELLRAQVKAHESELQPGRVVLPTPTYGRSPMR